MICVYSDLVVCRGGRCIDCPIFEDVSSWATQREYSEE